MNSKHLEIQEYYGKEVQKTADLKTSACCSTDTLPNYIKSILKDVHSEVIAKYYGCGLTIPRVLKGLRVLDLGSGSGRDSYIISKLVGENGSVTGVDMTKEQLDVANKFIDHHANVFGYKTSNVRFLQGNIEELDDLNLAPESFDLIISNCVINLATDKQKVLSDAFKLLKTGGEMYFSDVYCDRRIPEQLKEDPILYGECLSGAYYWNDFLIDAIKSGFSDPRSVENRPIILENEEIANKLGDAKFYSVTYRLFKIDDLERDCEDYGQALKYLGTIPGKSSSFDLDDHHHFPKGKVIPVCGNTYKMLCETRFKEHFEFYGNFDTHFGIFEGCGGSMPFSSEEDSSQTCC